MNSTAKIYRAGIVFPAWLLGNLLVFTAGISHAETKISAASGNYNAPATWAGGTVPNLLDSVVIANGHTVTLTSNTKVFSVTIENGAVLDNGNFDLTLYNYVGVVSYYTNHGKLLSSGGKLVVSTSRSVVMGGSGVTECDVEIAAGAAAIGANSSIHVSGNITVLAGLENAGNIFINGDISFAANRSFSNSGTITQAGNATFLSSPQLVEFNGTWTISGNLMLEEVEFRNSLDGTIDIEGDVLGTGYYSSVFANLGVAKFGGNVFPANDGKLALVSGNTVEYNGADQDIKWPDPLSGDSFYSNLVLSGSGTKKMEVSSAGNSNTILVIGDLFIRDTAAFSLVKLPYSYNLNLDGNWTNTSVHADPFAEGNGTVTLIDWYRTNDTITGSVAGGETFYNLIVNKANGEEVNLGCQVNVSNKLTLMTGGKIHTGSHEIYITNPSPDAISGHSAGFYIDGYLRRSLLASGGKYDFPVGNSDAYQLARVNFPAAHTFNQLLVNFSNLPPGTGLPVTDADGFKYSTALNCGGASPGTGNVNDGVWTITPDAGTAVYDLTLYARNHSNASLNTNTIIARNSASSAWQLTGTYVPATGSEPLIAQRNGCSGFSQFAIGGRELPFPIQFTASADSICKGDSATISASGGTSYLWNTGETSPAITVSPGATTSYKVTIYNGTQSTEANQTITVGVPDVSVIVMDYNTKIISTAAIAKQYRWFCNDTLIAGAAGMEYKPAKVGNYHLVITNAYGCPSVSNTLIVTSVGVAPGWSSAAAGDVLNIYPNPADAFVCIETENTFPSGFSIELMNGSGQLIYSETTNNNASKKAITIDVSAFARGLYFLKITKGSQVAIKKIMVN